MRSIYVAKERMPPREVPATRRRQSLPCESGRFWIGTSPVSLGHTFYAPQPKWVAGIRGQLEQGEQGLVHWQIVIRTVQAVR